MKLMEFPFTQWIFGSNQPVFFDLDVYFYAYKYLFINTFVLFSIWISKNPSLP